MILFIWMTFLLILIGIAAMAFVWVRQRPKLPPDTLPPEIPPLPTHPPINPVRTVSVTVNGMVVDITYMVEITASGFAIRVDLENEVINNKALKILGLPEPLIAIQRAILEKEDAILPHLPQNRLNEMSRQTWAPALANRFYLSPRLENSIPVGVIPNLKSGQSLFKAEVDYSQNPADTQAFSPITTNNSKVYWPFIATDVLPARRMLVLGNGGIYQVYEHQERQVFWVDFLFPTPDDGLVSVKSMQSRIKSIELRAACVMDLPVITHDTILRMIAGNSSRTPHKGVVYKTANYLFVEVCLGKEIYLFSDRVAYSRYNNVVGGVTDGHSYELIQALISMREKNLLTKIPGGYSWNDDKDTVYWFTSDTE